MTWTARRAAAIVAGVALLVGACTGGGDGGNGANRADGENGDGARAGGVLRLGVVRPASLDPARARTTGELLLADQLFDSLTAYDPETLEPVPSVAARWESTPDQKLFKFFLDPEATFADGRQITAADVKYTFERIGAQGSPSSVTDLLEPITGFEAFNRGESTEITGVKAPAPDVVEVWLDEPFAPLPVMVGGPPFGIVPRESVEAATPAFAEQPLGSGPFRIESRSEESLRLAPSEGAEVLVDSVEVMLFDDDDGAYAAFVAGDLDWTEVPAERVEEAAERYGRDGFAPYVAELFYGFNLKSPKFADARFREAIVRAVDRRSIIAAVYGGTVLPMDGVIVRGVPGHQESPCRGRCEHDVERARALVAEVFPDGGVHEVNIDFDDDRTQEAVARAIQSNLERVGIPAKLRHKPLREYQQFAVSGEQELFRLGWIAPYPSPDAFLAPLFVSGRPSNLTGMSSAPVDAAVGAARGEADRQRRIELYQEAERKVFEQIPLVPIAQFEIQTVSSDRVRGLQVTTAGTFDATKVWLAR